MAKKIKSILIANRGEIAIRVMRAANELGIRTIGIYANEDRFALHRFKADESYLVGEGKKPISAYLDIEDILRIAKQAGAHAIHPGYGFLSENPEFAEACRRNGIIFIGPEPDVMKTLGNKVDARNAAIRANVPVMPATKPLPNEFAEAKEMAAGVGYPLMLKASWGGGGRGMRVIEDEAALAAALPIARRESLAAFGNDEVYLEKLVQNARHVEVQIIGDKHGNIVHLYERDCSVQRRNQKVVERAPAPYLNDVQRKDLCQSAIRLMAAVNYTHAGTVEFLIDGETGKFYFIEVNPRIQVEHTVTEQVTGIDIVKAQILISEGAKIGTPESGIPVQEEIRLNGHALQCRVTTEDPENGFAPDYGKITTYRSAAGFGIRLDAGTAYAGAVITPYYDSLLVKVTAYAPTASEAIRRMDRALREFRVRGVNTNLQFLENVINHPLFVSGDCSTRFIDSTPELYQFPKRRDRATRLLKFIGEVLVNGNPEVSGRTLPKLPLPIAPVPKMALQENVPKGSRDLFLDLGASAYAKSLLSEKRILLTDTTMRDAHQSLFATRMRTDDMLKIAPYYAQHLHELFSVECWGGATFDVALRFLHEDPWARLRKIRNAVPNILLQMLLRSSNAVGYTNYPDNVVKQFVQQAAANGVDVFRVFDSLNWVDNMRVAMDAVIESGALCEGTICYTGDIHDPNRTKYNLGYYVSMARQLERAGAHILGIKDMAGVCRPAAVATLIKAIKEEVGLPVHFHTHDTSGASIASVLAAIEAGVDIVDGAMDSMSGLTSQPSLGGIIAATEFGPRSSGIRLEKIRPVSVYWEGVRKYYSPFEAEMRSGTSDVYLHEIPGGQYTNLREQARGLGIEQKWPAISQAYADVNQLFGDIIKVTPSSKVVGDMALFMVTNELTPEQVIDPNYEISFPESVVSLFKGEMGYPADGFPLQLQKKILQETKPIEGRAGAHMPPADFALIKKQAEEKIGRQLNESDLASYLMYPKVFSDYAEHHKRYGDVSLLPTPEFFYGMSVGGEISVEIDLGKTLVIHLQSISQEDEDGVVRVFFELNGQPRAIKIQKQGSSSGLSKRHKADGDNPKHIAAPMPGMVASISVKPGQPVKKGAPLASIEAMKMETMISAPEDGIVKQVFVGSGSRVDAKDLLVEMA